jgi:hypothetical protein
MTDAEPTPRKPSAIEKRAATDAAALAIIDKETLERENKTERLRALRLAQEAIPSAKAKKRNQK